jgi:hypothetical protein
MGVQARFYEIRCGRNDGSLSCLIVIARPSDASAVSLAHSLRGPSCETVEVWRDDHCVHRAHLVSSELAVA